MTAWLVPLFGLTALIYASVGFAGGSTYTALMVLAGLPIVVIPLISLTCNLIVSTGGMVRFARAGHVPWQRVWPMLLLSMPAAWLGGWIAIKPALFILLLGGSLCAAGALLLLGREHGATRGPAADEAGPGLFALAIALPLGFLSGLVGIGGGIFLAPLLHLIGWDSARRISGTATLFILANSLSGLVGQAFKFAGSHGAAIASSLSATNQQMIIWGLLVVAVAIGGQLGSVVGVRMLPPALIRRVTGGIVLFTGIRLLLS